MEMRLIYENDNESVIRLTGSIENVLYSKIDSLNAVRLNPQKAGYSLGLGGIGDSFKDIKDSLGELCTAPQATGVLTAGTENEPLFKSGGETAFFTPFNVSVGIEFQRLYKFDNPEKIMVSDLYNELFQEMNKQAGYKGMIAVSFLFKIEEFYGSLVKWAPLKGSMPEGFKIIDEDRFNNWFRAGEDPDKKGFLGISVGIGLDRGKSSFFKNEDLDRIFYLHPANAGNVKKQLHNHCFIIENSDLVADFNDYNNVVQRLLTNNKVIDIKHILDNTRVTPYYAAVSSTNSIKELDDSPL